MRIISQDGKRDVPYHHVTVYVSSVFPNEILVNFVAYRSTEVIGTYNSEEDALYVMKMIRTAVRFEQNYFYMPSADYVPVIRQKEAEGGEL